MKSILFILCLFAAAIYTTQNYQETETLKATFVEYANDMYYFTDKDDYSHEFQKIEKNVLDIYNLKEDSYKGKRFVITYATDTEEDKEGDNLMITIITGLQLQE